DYLRGTVSHEHIQFATVVGSTDLGPSRNYCWYTLGFLAGRSSNRVDFYVRSSSIFNPSYSFQSYRYQASSSTFKSAGYTEAQARHTMLESIRLADKARKDFLDEKRQSQGAPKIALSLGPFGASLSPAQEFDGYYPPPYGPVEFSEEGHLYNCFDEGDMEGEQKSIEALAKFHLDRLLVFAQDRETWAKVDILAFETVPLVREVKAIRKAMRSLESISAAEGATAPKPWWISFVLPNGKCPQTQRRGGPRLTVGDLVSAALVWTPRDATDFDGTSGPLPTPTAVGINCTSPELIPGLVTEITLAVDSFRASLPTSPWLVLYPNGGDVYDIISRSWILASEDKKHSWAVDLKQTVHSVSQDHSGVWGGFIIGGCCRTGPDLISRLKEELSSSHASSQAKL
ncbi:hypothetical protein H0H81_002569, partial [Sphagnurus paluster]